MKEFTVISKVATLHSGIVKLSKGQARDRMHCLAAVEKEDGLYKIQAPINFKHGEVFSFDGEVNKTMLSEIGEVVDVKAQKTAVKKEETKKEEEKKEETKKGFFSKK